jgi:hypothetical protein
MYKLSGAPCNDCRGDFCEVNSTGNALPLLLVGPQQLSIFCEGWFPISLVRIFQGSAKLGASGPKTKTSFFFQKAFREGINFEQSLRVKFLSL